ncbi:50S ribosomal protein L11 methyltransferase [Raphidocelis subcapitata]|uniref:50S ribosomal protein L11 methyltransferase n=1 Tax=Raphidocelis subcapitata TaxID=307507 RepID=A0A2V0PHX9_9CHLO|nr:50S ribosomal protein L11 methyltransferase [Raphidocelis subcapitata]|eukprot:GBF99179.1 50S ribosomal protein L11 methyltransferase [Raphidocelis subcapitata]
MSMRWSRGVCLLSRALEQRLHGLPAAAHAPRSLAPAAADRGGHGHAAGPARNSPGSGGGAHAHRAWSSSSSGGSGGSQGAPEQGGGLLAGGMLAELRSWLRFLLPGKYKAVYYPTPLPVVLRMLQLAGVGPSDVVYDLGCGDGRIVIAAVQQLGAKRAVGVELDPKLAAAARRAVAAAGLEGRVRIDEADAAGADLSDATVLALYLSASGNRALLDAVAGTLRRGTRVVSLYFEVEGWEAALLARDTSMGVEVYLYAAP